MITPISQVMVQKSFRFLLQSQAAIRREATGWQEHLRVLGSEQDDAKPDAPLKHGCLTLDVDRGENKGKRQAEKFITTEEAY